MHRPVLVTPPAILPVSLTEVKRHLYEDSTDNDARIEDLISSATEHLDGWDGIMGRCLVEQVWRQDFDRSGPCVVLALGPVIEIVSATGASGLIDPALYMLKVNAGGRSRVEFSGAAAPGPLSVVYRAGHSTIPAIPAAGSEPAVPAKSTVPHDIKNAIIIYVKAHFDDSKPDAVASAMRAIDDLVAKRRRVGV